LLNRVGLAILMLGLVACEEGPRRTGAIGEAYAGPAVLKIRRDIPLESPVVATVKHGERLELLQKRRRFFRVRVPSGVEGWTDERQLLAKEDMDNLKALAARAARMPEQGQATSFSELNVHTLPARQSPSFTQIRENEKVDVLEHVVAPRTDLPRKALLPPPVKKAPAAAKKPAKESKYPPLSPLPTPPGPPPNWLELSKTNSEDETDSEGAEKSEKEEAKNAQEKDAKEEEKPVPTDDWSLIRTKAGESGWVLTRRLVMAIPDEVAQYAEGRRIVSYFPLGEVDDGGQKKQDWLWTTISDGVRPYDFESFRVFIWSLRRHRYETAYIERNLHGYAPVLLQEVELSISKGGDPAKYPGFSMCVEKSDGQRYRREYAFLTNVVRFAGERPCEPASQESATTQAAVLPSGPAAAAQEQASSRNFTARVRQRFQRWFGR
jgi:hypothetical protein